MNDNDHLKQLNELALNYGRKLKSSQTGFLHLSYGMHESEPHLSIPLFENFLFAYALFKSRLVENINEAKGLLDRLLHFQNKQQGELGYGNFPIYLHDYPICKDRFLGLHLGYPIYWILSHYHQVLGVDLKKRLENSLQMIIQHALSIHQEKAAPYPLAIKMAALAQAGGKYLQKNDFIEAGQIQLEKLEKHPDLLSWYCPASLGTILLGLSLVHSSLKEGPWAEFWTHLESCWHPFTCSYVGPALKEWQEGLEPQVTLYDFFMGYFSNSFSKRALTGSMALLEAVLIPSSSHMIAEKSYPFKHQGNFNGAMWMIVQEKEIAYCLIEQGLFELNPMYEKGFHPLKIIGGNAQRTHSFVCQNSQAVAAQFTVVPKGIAMTFSLTDLPIEEDREKSRELSFFIDAADGLTFLVDEKKASTFQLGETLSLSLDNLKLKLSFTLAQGEGTFMGHRILGNRLSQISNKGIQRYHAYDWQIFLRTLRRSTPCQINVLLQFEH